MTLALAIAGGLLVLMVAAIVVPRALVRRSQDRMAAEAIARAGSEVRLLTRADVVSGRYRRIPGILGLTAGSLDFEGLFGESLPIPTARIRKVETGTRLASGRLLFRMEVLRITRSTGDIVEFVLTRPTATAWRSHLGLWAGAQRQTDAERVTPGRTGSRESGIGNGESKTRSEEVL